MEERFNVVGKVQGVFFRKTFVHGLNKRGLKGGATNSQENKNLVHCTVIGRVEDRESLKRDLKALKQINALGASVTEIQEVDHGIALQNHDVHTNKLSDKKFNLGLKSYL